MTKQGCAFPTVGAARGITMAMGGGVVNRHMGGSPGKAGSEGFAAGRSCAGVCRSCAVTAVLAAGGGVTETDERRDAGAVATPAGAASAIIADSRRGDVAGSAAVADSRRFVLMNVVVGIRCGGGGGVLMMAWASATATDDCGIAARRAIR